MGGFLLRRLLTIVPTLWAIGTLTFFMLRWAPGGPFLAERDIPEGARIQLDPALTDRQIQAWGCTGSCLIIAHAMQQYGMIVVDRSNRPKIFVEYEQTAHWNNLLEATTISKIPYARFKVLKIVR